MLARDLVTLFILPLNRAGAQYMVTGSVAAMLYGEPRMTHDIDLVVDLQSEQIGALIHAFAPAEFYVPPEEVIGVEIARTQRGHLNIIHHATGYNADIYLHGDDPVHRWGMKNRRTMTLDNEEIFIAPPEYVILRKLEYYRESGYQKHIIDIEGMFRVGGKELSLPALNEWIKKLSLEKEWAALKRT